ncbi:NTP transferase domain-containing protein [candidate division KSB1 bacterium]|nr:NTP transferase domain-containing protein [candidate division KSB1 bacterium]
MNRAAIGVILAGGMGRRLWPLTQKRSKPAVPIAGKFRLIDIPISNCLYSEIRKIFVLTQFNSESLNRHITQTYTFPPIAAGFVQILAAQQKADYYDWYQGTADAVRQNLAYLQDKHAECYVILSGDQLYKMDYRKLIKYHFQKHADVTIGVYPVSAKQTERFGIIQTNAAGHILNYVEKPSDPSVINSLKSPASIFQKLNIQNSDGLLGSMGIYIFSPKALFDILNTWPQADFGGGIFPPVALDARYRTFAYFFDGYWEDIGTIASFFHAMLDLTQPDAHFDFFDQKIPIFTHPRFLPGAKINHTHCTNAIICEGSIIDQSEITDAIIGIRSIIRPHNRLRRVVMMGADYYEEGEEYGQVSGTQTELGIGENCVIEDAIIDKNAIIGKNVQILKAGRTSKYVEQPNYVIQDGIVIIPKNAVIPPDTVIQ